MMGSDRSVVVAAFLLLIALGPARAAADDSNDNAQSNQKAGPIDPYESPARAIPAGSPFDPTKPIPSGFHVADRPTSPLVIVGGVMFGVSYGTSLLGGIEALVGGRSYKGCPSDGWLALPIVGPFAASIELDGRVGTGCADPEGFQTAIYRLDGVVQLVGSVLLFAGVASSGPTLVKDAAKSDSTTGATNGAHWRVIPRNVGTSGAGVDLVGIF